MINITVLASLHIFHVKYLSFDDIFESIQLIGHMMSMQQLNIFLSPHSVSAACRGNPAADQFSEGSEELVLHVSQVEKRSLGFPLKTSQLLDGWGQNIHMTLVVTAS